MAIRFIPGDEQRMLRESVRRWVARHDARHAESLAAAWSHFVEMGWLAAGFPEEAGGLGGESYDTAIIAEELGYGLIRAPFVEIGVTAAQVLLRIAPDRVARLAAGDTRPVLAHDELEARGDPEWIATTAVRDGGDWRLTGRKTGIIGAPCADTLLVSAIVDGSHVQLFEVATTGAPLKFFTTIDDRAAAELLLSDTPAQPIAMADRALPVIRRALDHALVLESAEALGAMQRAFDLTRDYLLTRRQFGQRLGDFQVLRHRLADMFIEIEQARSMVLRGLDALSASNAQLRSLHAAATKARVAQAGAFVTAQAVQLHGGIGVTEEYPVGHYFKRLVAFEQRHGSATVQVARVAEMLSNAAPERNSYR